MTQETLFGSEPEKHPTTEELTAMAGRIAASMEGRDPYEAQNRREAELAKARQDSGGQTGPEQTGFWPELVDTATAAVDPPRYPEPRKPRPSRRGGRSYPEGTDSELDPNMKGPSDWLSPEQVPIYKKGADLARRALAVRDFEKLLDDTHGNVALQQALLRAREDKRLRDQ